VKTSRALYDSARQSFLPLAFLVLPLLWFSACQTGSVSVEEARRITTEVQEAPFHPPAPTVDDIFVLLERGQAAEWRDRFASDRTLADLAPPSGRANSSDLASFYYRRGIAAQDIGRAQQQLQDLRQAVELGRQSPGSDAAARLSALGYAEQFVGRYGRHPALRQEAINNNSGAAPRLIWNTVLARHFADSNDAAAAAAALARAEPYRSQVESGDPTSARFERSYYLYGWAAVTRAQGATQESEAYARQAIVELNLLATPTGRRTTIHDLADGKRFRLREAHLELAASLSAQGRLQEAEVEARNALVIATTRWGRDGYETAFSLVAVAEAVLQQGRAADGERLAREAVGIFDRIGAAPEALGRARARRLVALSLVLREQWPEALAEFEAIAQQMSEDPVTLKEFFQGDVDWAATLIRNRRAAEAAQRLAPTVRLLEQNLPREDYSLVEARGVLAVAFASSGQAERAVEQFRAAVPVLLARPPGTDDWGLVSLQERRRQGILEGYVALLDRIRGTPLEQKVGVDPVTEAFRVADAARGRSVQQALGAGAARTAAAKDAVLLDLVQREQNSKKQIDGLYRELSDLAAKPRDAKDNRGGRRSPDVVRAQIEAVKQARAALGVEIRRGFPAYAELMEPQPATMDEARAALGEGEALLAVHVGRERSFVWAVPRSGAVAFASLPVTGDQIAALVARIRQSVTPTVGTLAAQPVFDAEAAYQLYEALLKPVSPGWHGARNLVVVPHGPLGQLPFGLMLTTLPAAAAPTTVPFAQYMKLPWLVREVAITQLPSVASLRILRNVSVGRSAQRPFIGFGDPWFSQDQARQAAAQLAGVRPLDQDEAVGVRASLKRRRGVGPAELGSLPRLPDTAEEIRALGQTLGADPGRDILLGPAANTRAVKTLDLADYRVIAFATHGLTPGALDGLAQPALALSAPDVAHVEGNGLLTMEEILGLKLNADWVVLSACDTGAGAGEGAEAVSGLGRAFFFAGTRALLVTQWSVESTSAKTLTTELFRRQAAEPGLNRAEALRAAQLALIDGRGAVDPAGRTLYAYAHPMFWAAFALVGDGGR
jgi:CHAT domain-containing protein